MKYTEKTLESNYSDNLNKAKQALRNLDFVCGVELDFKGLNGWVFEQTIRKCLIDELVDKLQSYDVREQETLKGRATVDLVLGRAAIEIKSGGLFKDESEKYAKLRTAAIGKGWEYLYITRDETYVPFKESAKKAFGEDKAFFLNEEGTWMKFVEKVIEINRVDISNQKLEEC